MDCSRSAVESAADTNPEEIAVYSDFVTSAGSSPYLCDIDRTAASYSAMSTEAPFNSVDASATPCKKKISREISE